MVYSLYTATAYLGTQSTLEIMDEHGDSSLGLAIEIDKGVPTIHINIDGGDSVLHLHKSPKGLVITPDNREVTINSAELDRYSYNDHRSLVVS